MNTYRFEWGVSADQVWIVDCRSKSTNLIAQLFREIGLCSQIFPPEEFNARVRVNPAKQPRVVVISGSGSGVYEKDAPYIRRELVEAWRAKGTVFMGICYGAQLLAHLFGGRVEKASGIESGKVNLRLNRVFGAYHGGYVVMNHGDSVVALPPGWKNCGSTERCRYALFADTDSVSGHPGIICMQFHPEMGDTEYADTLLEYIALILARCRRDYRLDPQRFISSAMDFVQETSGDRGVVVGLSGGVDSSTLWEIIRRAKNGKRALAVYVNTGFTVEGEMEWIQETFADKNPGQVLCVDAADEFYDAVETIPYVEGGEDDYFDAVRMVVGHTFVKVFEREAAKATATLGENPLLGQGTNAADIHDARLKRHHNVGGLPDRMNLDVLEVLAGLYKKGIRIIAEALGLPPEVVWRQPSPGPGNSIRTWGRVTRQKARALARGNRILHEIIAARYPNYRDRPQQYYVALAPLPTCGFMGDNRRYGYLWYLRAVTSGRETYASNIPFVFSPNVFAEISDRLTSEVVMEDGTPFVGVMYAITGKPPLPTEPH